MAKIDGIDITSLLWQEGSAPSTPASTKWRLYFKTTGLFYKDDAGTEIGPLAAAGTHTVYGCTVTMSSTAVAQSGVALTFDAEVRDDGGMYSAGSPTRITIQSTGWYFGTGFVTHAADSDGGRRVFWRLNGSTTVGRSSVVSPAAMNDPTVMASFGEYLTATDYLELVADQNSGGNLNLTARASVIKIPFD